ncbi:MAG: hypothetical protein AAB593_00820 [Patescibacteria group bacterium]
MNKLNVLWILRIAVFGEFFGHGIFALQGKEKFVNYIMSVGISHDTAAILLMFVGIMDIIVALVVLFRPISPILLWAAFWGFATELIRPIAGEPIWDFLERWANIGAPLALYYLLKKK